MMRLLIFFFILFLESTSCWARTFVYKVDLGMSASYHPYNKGFLLQDHGSASNPKISVLKRFLQARKEILNKSDQDLYGFFYENYFDKQASYWEGLCDRWSASALDQDVIDYIKSFPTGMTCGEQIFSVGELKDLLSFLYPLSYESEKIVGRQTSTATIEYQQRVFKTSRDLDLPIFSKQIRDQFGWDDLWPHQLQDLLIQNLSQGQGVILDLSPDRYVWNYPVTEAQIDIQSVRYNQYDYLFKIPLQYLVSTDQKINQVLSFLKTYDLKIKNLIGPFYHPSELREAEQSWQSLNVNLLSDFKILLSENRELLNLPYYEKCELKSYESHSPQSLIQCLKLERANYFNVKRALIAYIEFNSRKSKPLINIQKDLQVEKVTLQLKYFLPGPLIYRLLGRGYDFSNETQGTRRFEYLLIKKSGEIIASVWLTSQSSRPDLAWTPIRQHDSFDSEDDILIELFNDLIKLKEHCQPL